MSRHLVLAGAGHAQLDLLASLARERPDDWRVTVITSQPAFHYSGMLPAIIAGVARADAAQVPVAAIARAAGMDVRVAGITALDATRRVLTLHGGEQVSYDLLSLDVGSVPAALDVPGAAEFAHPMRPFHAALQLCARLDEALNSASANQRVPAAVVGAGAAGVEVALAVRARILAAGRVPEVTIVDASVADGLPLAGFDEATRTLAARALDRRGVALLAGHVTSVEPDAVRVKTSVSEVCLRSVATAWVTGPAAPPWLAHAGLECDPRGYPLVAPTLALGGGCTAFGGGDCVTLREAPGTAKAGVYAVRMAPILTQNVRSALRGQPASARYRPQRGFLALLSTGDGAALLSWRGFAIESRWVQRLKDRIDRRYLERYQGLAR